MLRLSQPAFMGQDSSSGLIGRGLAGVDLLPDVSPGTALVILRGSLFLVVSPRNDARCLSRADIYTFIP